MSTRNASVSPERASATRSASVNSCINGTVTSSHAICCSHIVARMREKVAFTTERIQKSALAMTLSDSHRLHHIAGTNVAHHIHSGRSIAENGVVGRKIRLVFQADEELAAVGIRASISHRYCASFVWPLYRFILEFITRPA